MLKYMFSCFVGRMVKRKVEEYEYDVALEPSYLASMLKQFNKTLTEGYFSMIIVDAVNSKVCKEVKNNLKLPLSLSLSLSP